MAKTRKGEQVFTNCTTGGPVEAYVKDGQITRIEPLKLGPDDAGDWTITARGKKFSPGKRVRLAPYTLSERSRIYGSSRVLYPMKRVDFNPKGKRNPEKRGISGYERISWDEAMEILSGEIIRVHRDHGPGAVMASNPAHHNWGNVGYWQSAWFRFLDILGYTYTNHSPESWEGFYWGAMHAWGFGYRLGSPEQYDLLEDGLKNAEMIVFWSADPEATGSVYNGQETTPWRFWLKELGVKMVFIDPFYNYTAVTHCDKWLAPRVGTDTALACAIAHVWFTENLYDKGYVKTHTYGFDKWKDYILGKTDGIPKTPEWAAEETALAARDIRALAREWGKKKTMIAAGGIGGWGGACRMAYATEWARMIVYLAAMQGLGKPGSNLWGTGSGGPYNYGFFFPGYAEGGIAGDTNNSGAAFQFLMRGMPEHPVTTTINQPGGQTISEPLTPECVLDPPQEWRCKGFAGTVEGQFKKYRYPEEGYSEVKMYWKYGGSTISAMQESNRWVKMYRSPKLEFIVNQNIYMEGDTKFADLILPACSNFERWDIGEWANCSGYIPHSNNGCNHRVIVLQKKAIEPLGESMSDYNIFATVAKKLGIEFYMKFTEGGKSELDWVKAYFAATDLSKVMTWKEFEKKGYYVVPMPKNYKPTVSFRWFAENRWRDTPCWGPQGGAAQTLSDLPGGLFTQSGKIEFESQSLKRFDPNEEDWERPHTAKHLDSWEGHHTTELYNRYPLQLISPHPRFTFHSQYDGKETFVNEIPDHRLKKEDGYYYWIIRINPSDAEKRGIKDGDLVKAYNDRGELILAAQVTERIAPGTVHSYEGSALYDPIGEPGKSADRGGVVNLLTPSRFISKNAHGIAPNSCLIEIKKQKK
ncbi:molybdopterin-dependent oxidoreductase [Thermodesulfobacteriota bacterium]